MSNSNNSMIDKIWNELHKYMDKTNFQVSELNKNEFVIEPARYKGSELDGMQIIFEKGIYEVSEFQAGKDKNELHVFMETKSLKIAVKNMLKGNKRPKSKILKIWK